MHKFKQNDYKKLSTLKTAVVNFYLKLFTLFGAEKWHFNIILRLFLRQLLLLTAWCEVNLQLIPDIISINMRTM